MGWGEGKGRRSETSWGLSRPIPRGLSLNPSPAGRREDEGDVVGWDGVTHTRTPLSPWERRCLPTKSGRGCW